MKSHFTGNQIFIGLFILALALFACNFGVQPSTASPQQISSNTPPAVQQSSAATSSRGTPNEAQAMLQKAVAHYNAVGRDQALKDFNNRVASFFDRDLYVACIDSHLIISANGGFPNLVGSAVEPLSRAAWDAAAKDKISSITYQYLNPATGKTEPKTFYYEKVGSDVCGVGAYHP